MAEYTDDELFEAFRKLNPVPSLDYLHLDPEAHARLAAQLLSRAEEAALDRSIVRRIMRRLPHLLRLPRFALPKSP